MTVLAKSAKVLSVASTTAAGASKAAATLQRAADAAAALDPVDVARWYGWARAGIGAAMTAAPATSMAGMFGKAESDRPAMRTMTTMFGMREVVIGAAQARAVQRGDVAAIRRLAYVGLVCDATDLTVALRNLASGRTPRKGAALVVLAAGGGIAMAGHILYRLR